MDVVIEVRMICVEDKGKVAVASILWGGQVLWA